MIAVLKCGRGRGTETERERERENLLCVARLGYARACKIYVNLLCILRAARLGYAREGKIYVNLLCILRVARLGPRKRDREGQRQREIEREVKHGAVILLPHPLSGFVDACMFPEWASAQGSRCRCGPLGPSTDPDARKARRINFHVKNAEIVHMADLE